MKVYLVETVKDLGSPSYDIDVVHVSSTFENAVLFIKKCLDDDNDDLESDSVMQIVEETVDSPSNKTRLIDRLTSQEWLDNGEKIAININNYKKLLEHVVEEEVSCYDLQS